MTGRKPLPPQWFAELQGLIDAAHQGGIRPGQMKRLEELLRDPTTCDLYLELVWESDVLATWAKVSEQERLAAIRRAARPTVLGFLHSSLRLAGRTIGRHPAAAASLALVAAVSLAAWFASTPVQPQVASHEDGSRSALPIKTAPELASDEEPSGRRRRQRGRRGRRIAAISSRRRVANPVARLARAVDCLWSGGPDAPEAGDDLAAGDKLVLRRGLAEIVFGALRSGSAARMILQGPATLAVRSRASAVLDRGKCTVTVETPSARGFEIHAPGMKYTDLGTEFGVAVAENGVQEVHVFRGKVQAERAIEAAKGRKGDGEKGRKGDQNNRSLPFAPLPVSPSPPRSSPPRLTAHQAIRVATPDAVGKAAEPIELMAANAKQFVRALPPATALDLVDIVAGGDGLSTRRNREINPTNGRFSDEPGGKDNIAQGEGTVFQSDHQYHRVPANQFIDGVFIVHGGKGPVQLDSAGHRFAGFPKNGGKTANMIQAVGATPAHPQAWFTAKQNSLPQLGGVDYSSIGHGVLAVRSNKGITFDLAAVRAAHQRLLFACRSRPWPATPAAKTRRVRATSGYSSTASSDFSGGTCAVNSGPVPLEVPLQPADRYLTLVATTTYGQRNLERDHVWRPETQTGGNREVTADANKAD